MQVLSYLAMATAIWQPWSCRYRGGGGCTYGTAVSWRSSVWKRVRWCEIQTKWRRSVVGERFCEAVLASPHPWQSPDCIPIVGSVKALVQNDKSFNHTKVWCTFIFIDLQASKSKVKCKWKGNKYVRRLSLGTCWSPKCDGQGLSIHSSRPCLLPVWWFAISLFKK